MFSQTQRWSWHLDPQELCLLVLLRSLWELWVGNDTECPSLVEATPGHLDIE